MATKGLPLLFLDVDGTLRVSGFPDRSVPWTDQMVPDSLVHEDLVPSRVNLSEIQRVLAEASDSRDHSQVAQIRAGPL